MSQDCAPTVDTTSETLSSPLMPATPEEKKSCSSLGFVDTLTFILATTCGLLSGLAVLGAPGDWKKYVIYAAFATSFLMSCFMTVQRIILVLNPEIRDVINKIRGSVNRMQDENNKLGVEVDLLQEKANQLKETEDKLAAICERQGINVSNMTAAAKENGELLRKIKRRIKAQAMADMMRIVFEADDDEDYTIDQEEIPELVLRLESEAQVKIDRQKFEEALKECDYAISGVMALIRDVADDGNATFTVKEIK